MPLHLCTNDSSGFHRPARFDHVDTAVPDMLRISRRKVAQIPAVQLLENVLELVRDPFRLVRPGLDGDRRILDRAQKPLSTRVGSTPTPMTIDGAAAIR